MRDYSVCIKTFFGTTERARPNGLEESGLLEDDVGCEVILSCFTAQYPPYTY